MNKASYKSLSPLGVAAIAFDEELQRFEHLAAAAQRVPLHSQKQLDRAARATDEAADSQRRMGELLQELVAALTVVRDQNQRTAEAMEARRAELRRRGEELAALTQRFHALGNEAKEVSSEVQQLGQARPGPADSSAALAAIEERMSGIVTRAQSLHADARAADAADLLAPVDSLRQQVLSARNKIALLRQQLGSASTR